jgi:hypothetical protein
MSFQLIDSDWARILDNAISLRSVPVKVICPFIKVHAAHRFLPCARGMQVITRFHLGNFYDGVSDTEALRNLLANGACIRGVRNLHAKMYLFGRKTAIVTSANLTDAALSHNHEFGFVADENAIIERCEQYFIKLWEDAKRDLTSAMLDDWEEQLTAARLDRKKAPPAPRWPDYGTSCGLTGPAPIVPPIFSEAPRSFVKFFGEGDNRAEHTMTVFDEIDRSGCHWACTYPRNKRPRQVADGAVMFMGRLVQNPNDTMIFGRAIGMRYQDGRDDASPSQIKRRPWKSDWPHYIRIHHPEFVAGTLANGISLSELIDRFGSNAFASTKRNVAHGAGNTNPRKAVRQQAAVELTPESHEWLDSSLAEAFQSHGTLGPEELAKLDQAEFN